MKVHPCAGCDRRAFLGRATLAAAGALLTSACGDGRIGATPSDPGGGSDALVVSVASFPALAAIGGAARVDGGSPRPVALVRTAADAFLALSLSCPHQGTRVIVTGSGFRCPNHGATFDREGDWVGGQVTTRMRVLPSVYDPAAGTVTVG